MACYSRKLAKGTLWYYKFVFHGHTYFSKCIYKSKTEAKRAEADAYTKAQSMERITHDKMQITLKDAIADRLEYLKEAKSNKYYLDSKRYLEDFENFINYNLMIWEVNEYRVSEYIIDFSKKMRKDNRKNYSVNAMMRCLKALFNYCKQKYSLDMDNPVKMQLFPIDNRLKYIPTDDEINILLEACDDGQKLLVRFIMETGARINEALKLTYDDIKDDYIVLYTRKSKNSNLTLRKVPKPEFMNLKGNGLVFGRWTDRPKFIDKKLEELKLRPWAWHNIRHRYASLLSKQNKPIFEIMGLLGHSNLETTQRYLQLLP